MTILTDRSQGGSSIEDGCLELMVKFLFKKYTFSYVVIVKKSQRLNFLLLQLRQKIIISYRFEMKSCDKSVNK